MKREKIHLYTLLQVTVIMTLGCGNSKQRDEPAQVQTHFDKEIDSSFHEASSVRFPKVYNPWNDSSYVRTMDSLHSDFYERLNVLDSVLKRIERRDSLLRERLLSE